MMRALPVGLAVALSVAPARSAPMGVGEPVTVLGFDTEVTAGPELDSAAKSLTNALRQRVIDAPEYALAGQSRVLYLVAGDAGCRPKVAPGRDIDERSFDEPCLRKVARHLGTKRFFWGFLAVEGGRAVARLHLWREGQPDRVAELPYDEGARDRVAARLYAKLVRPDQVGDLTLSGEASGELWVDGRAEGAYSPGLELTLPAGDHELEVRQGPRVVARARAAVAPGGRAEARLEPVAAPSPSPPPVRVADPPPVTIRPKASAWPWVLGGTAAAGLAGAGAFWALRGAAKGDAESSCSGAVCLEGARGDVERADRYGALSAVSLGVGLAAGAGLAAYLGLARQPPRVVGGLAPVAGGGAALSVGGSF